MTAPIVLTGLSVCANLVRMETKASRGDDVLDLREAGAISEQAEAMQRVVAALLEALPGLTAASIELDGDVGGGPGRGSTWQAGTAGDGDTRVVMPLDAEL